MAGRIRRSEFSFVMWPEGEVLFLKVELGCSLVIEILRRSAASDTSRIPVWESLSIVSGRVL